MNFFKVLLFVFAGLLVQHIEPFTYKITVWQRTEPSAEGNKNLQTREVVICHDFHNMSRALNKAQVDYWKNNIGAYHDCVSFFENQNIASLEQLRQKNLQLLISELVDLAQKNGISHELIEYRHKKCTAYGFCIHALAFTQESQDQAYRENLAKLNMVIQPLLILLQNLLKQSM